MSLFEYPYRWQQIFGHDEATQIAMLEERDRAIEGYFHEGGSCPLELPYRWVDIWPALLAGEGWAIACAEENDRTIEGLFANCSCEPDPGDPWSILTNTAFAYQYAPGVTSTIDTTVYVTTDNLILSDLTFIHDTCAFGSCSLSLYYDSGSGPVQAGGTSLAIPSAANASLSTAFPPGTIIPSGADVWFEMIGTASTLLNSFAASAIVTHPGGLPSQFVAWII